MVAPVAMLTRWPTRLPVNEVASNRPSPMSATSTRAAYAALQARAEMHSAPGRWMCPAAPGTRRRRNRPLRCKARHVARRAHPSRPLQAARLARTWSPSSALRLLMGPAHRAGSSRFGLWLERSKRLRCLLGEDSAVYHWRASTARPGASRAASMRYMAISTWSKSWRGKTTAGRGRPPGCSCPSPGWLPLDCDKHPASVTTGGVVGDVVEVVFEIGELALGGGGVPAAFSAGGESSGVEVAVVAYGR